MTVEDALTAAVGATRGTVAADRLCAACVDVLSVDAAAISLVFDGASTGTLGSSDESARIYDELQFTLGEGPCMESVAAREPVLVVDLADPGDTRWPAYAQAMLGHNIRGVFALPVLLAGEHLGALDLFRSRPGALNAEDLAGALVAAELAEIPVLDLLGENLQVALNDPDSDVWDKLSTITRTEVSQATGMLVAQLEVSPAEALVRLRAFAYASGRTASDIARDILARRLHLDADRSRPGYVPDEEVGQGKERAMPSDNREARVLDAVVTLVDSLLDDFDVVELLTDLTERCAQLLDIESAGLLLADPRRRLQLMAATSDRTEEVELFQLQSDEGPCLDCFVSGRPVSTADLRDDAERWPRFVAAATEAGFASVHALPMRVAGTVLGALGLFGSRVGELNAADLLVGRSLAHVASVAILQPRPPTVEAVLPQLRTALASRVVVEQAKGFLRERLGLEIADAFAVLRSYARSSGIPLTELSRRLMNEPQGRAGLVAALAEHAAIE